MNSKIKKTVTTSGPGRPHWPAPCPSPAAGKSIVVRGMDLMDVFFPKEEKKKDQRLSRIRNPEKNI